MNLASIILSKISIISLCALGLDLSKYEIIALAKGSFSYRVLLSPSFTASKSFILFTTLLFNNTTKPKPP
nr:MAG TPA: hypothetical protein [Caudoviricetes sp.]